MGGTGFLGAAVQPELGAPNAGRDADLDALAAYLMSLPALQRSPYRQNDGSLSEAAIRGATFFVGSDRAGHTADASCADCHRPETGFVDFKFHDVGQRRASSENELNTRDPRWHVGTTTLIGLWATPLFGGTSTFGESHHVSGVLLNILNNQVARAGDSNAHGSPDGLTIRQLHDLKEFVLSIDGQTTAEEVRGARDSTPPRLVRVEVSSLRSIDVWFSETVEEASVEDTSHWTLTTTNGTLVPIDSATWDAVSGDRVRLEAALNANTSYDLAAGTGIRDAAATASGGVANQLDESDPDNTRRVSITDRLTVSFGVSGAENWNVRVHDSAMTGSNLATWNHDHIWLFPSGGDRNAGFLRFEWQAAARAAGIVDSDQILEASLTLHGDFGDAERLELRRTLQRLERSTDIARLEPPGRWSADLARPLASERTLEPLGRASARNVRFESERLQRQFRSRPNCRCKRGHGGDQHRDHLHECGDHRRLPVLVRQSRCRLRTRDPTVSTAEPGNALFQLGRR